MTIRIAFSFVNDRYIIERCVPISISNPLSVKFCILKFFFLEKNTFLEFIFQKNVWITGDIVTSVHKFLIRISKLEWSNDISLILNGIILPMESCPPIFKSNGQCWSIIITSSNKVGDRSIKVKNIVHTSNHLISLN